MAFLENLPDTGLPGHGGTATVGDGDPRPTTPCSPGPVSPTTSTGDRVTAEQARRLACQARIIPVVLGGKGEVLDLGRSARLFSPAQRKALAIRDRECTDRRLLDPRRLVRSPPRQPPWSSGGKTDLADGKLLCSFHHHRAHDPAWQTHHHANGSTSFHRRT